MPLPDGIIDSSNLCSQAVVERVLADQSVSSVKIANDIQSDNFSAGSAGWKIFRNTGAAEFQDVIIRGTLNASDLSAGTINASTITITNINASNISTGTLSASRIAANSLAISKISGGTYGNADITFSSGSDLISSNFSAGSAGWKISGNGDAEFNNVTVRGTLFATDGTNTINIDPAGFSATNAFIEFDIGQDTELPILQGSLAGGSSGISLLSGLDGAGSNSSIGVSQDFIFINAGTAGSNVFSSSKFAMQVVIEGKPGDASLPGYAFSGDPDTGMYRKTTNEIGFSIGGSLRFRIGPDLEGRQTTGNFHIENSSTPSVTVPTYSFFGDTDTGMYRVGANQIGFAIGGSVGARIFTGGEIIAGGSTGGSVSIPAFTFHTDTNTGMYRHGADEVGIAAGGATMARFKNTTTDEIHMQPIYDNATTGDDTVGVTVTGLLRRQTSALKYKRNIQPMPSLADIELVPVEYDTIPTDAAENGDHHRYGLIADWIQTQLPDACTYNAEGEVENFQDRAVLAILAAKINRLEAQHGT